MPDLHHRQAPHETLDEMVESGKLAPELALQVQLRLDEVRLP
jgi:hypothetical protein